MLVMVLLLLLPHHDKAMCTSGLEPWLQCSPAAKCSARHSVLTLLQPDTSTPAGGAGEDAEDAHDAEQQSDAGRLSVSSPRGVPAEGASEGSLERQAAHTLPKDPQRSPR